MTNRASDYLSGKPEVFLSSLDFSYSALCPFCGSFVQASCCTCVQLVSDTWGPRRGGAALRRLPDGRQALISPVHGNDSPALSLNVLRRALHVVLAASARTGLRPSLGHAQTAAIASGAGRTAAGTLICARRDTSELRAGTSAAMAQTSTANIHTGSADQAKSQGLTGDTPYPVPAEKVATTIF